MILRFIYWIIAHRLDIWYAVVRVIKILVTIAWAIVTAIAILTGHFLKGMFRSSRKK